MMMQIVHEEQLNASIGFGIGMVLRQSHDSLIVHRQDVITYQKHWLEKRQPREIVRLS